MAYHIMVYHLLQESSPQSRNHSPQITKHRWYVYHSQLCGLLHCKKTRISSNTYIYIYIYIHCLSWLIGVGFILLYPGLSHVVYRIPQVDPSRSILDGSAAAAPRLRQAAAPPGRYYEVSPPG